MAVEQRFLPTFREEGTDDPGLILDEDLNVWLILPDGNRVLLSGSILFQAGWQNMDEPELPVGGVSLRVRNSDNGGFGSRLVVRGKFAISNGGVIDFWAAKPGAAYNGTLISVVDGSVGVPLFITTNLVDKIIIVHLDVSDEQATASYTTFLDD